MAGWRSRSFWLGIALFVLATQAHAQAYSLIAIHDFRHLVTDNEALTPEQRQYPALVFEFEGLAFTEDGNLWASIAADPEGSSRELWKLDLQSRTAQTHPHPGELLPSFPLSQYGNPVGLAGMGSQLIVGHNFHNLGNLIGSFDPANPTAWNPMFSLDTATCNEVEGLAYLGGKLYASCQNDGKVLEMDPASGAVSRTFGFANQVLGLAETGDGRLIVGTYPQGERELLIFDPEGQRPTGTISINQLFVGTDSDYYRLTGESYSVQVVPSEQPRTRPDPDGLAYRNGTIYMSFDGDLRIFEIATNIWGAKRSDFNGDLKADIVWRNMATGVNSIWFMDGTTRTSYATAPAVTPGADWEIVGVGDFDKDGKSDLMWRNTNSASGSFGRNTIWLMNGASRTSYGEIARIADANWNVAGVADFNGDGKADILWRNETTGQNSVWFMNGVTRTSYSLAPSVAGSEWKIAGVGDFNMDGKADLMWRNTATGSANFGRNTIWLMNGASRTSYGEIARIADANWFVAGVADFNGDGKADILWRNEATGQNSIWFMNEVTRTSYALAPSVVGAEWKVFALGDYNMDGKADLMWRNTAQGSANFGRNTIWLMIGATRTSYGELQRIADPNWKVISP